MEESKTLFTPDDFQEFAEIEDENIVLGINVGRELEVRSRNFYQNRALKMPSDRRIVLKFLADEELNHLRTLTAFKMELQKRGHWIEFSEVQMKKVTLPRLFVGKGSVPLIEEGAYDGEIIAAAMKAEAQSADFYNEIGAKVTDAR